MPTKTKSLATSRETRIEAVRDRIIAIIDQPLEPVEFCEKWVKTPLHSQARDYKKACERAIADALGFMSPGDVSMWGKDWQKRPDYVPQLLRLADIVKSAKELGVCADKIKSYSYTKGQEVCICLPFGIPKPKFHFWQRVKIDDEYQDCGVIVGMDYATETGFGRAKLGWWYSVELDEGIDRKRLEPVRSAAESDVRSL
ncbi:MAG TPA: hypothetical protein V6C57_29630 [Coleofasciculaceae cyanobacterium]